MLMWCKDKELSKYNKYKVKNGLSENGTSSECARVAHSLTGVLLGGLHLLASACMASGNWGGDDIPRYIL